jgi:Na+-transporting methylmalonyl-CoA/oxaloacetate decarboxylase beta subunit
LSIVNIITIVSKYILFYLIHAESAIRERLANAATNKQMALTSVFLEMGIGTNISAPFLPGVDPETYCLVLDLDETLVHFFFVIE